MALVDTPDIMHPTPLGIPRTNSTRTMDATGEMVGFITQIPKDGNITKVLIRTAGVTNTANGVDIGIQTVDASGDPSGSAYKGMAVASGQAVSSSTFIEATLGTQASSVAEGDVVAIVTAFNSFTAGDRVDLAANATIDEDNRFGYSSIFTGSWGKDIDNVFGVCALGYDDGTYEPITGCWPGILQTVSFNNATSPNVIGNRFQLTFGCRVKGAWMRCDVDVLDDFNWELAEDDNTAIPIGLASANLFAVDGAQVRYTSVGNFFYHFGAKPTLSADTWYRLSVNPSTTNNLSIVRANSHSAATLAGYGQGLLNYQSTSNDGGTNWTDDTIRRVQIGLIIDQIETGGAGAAGQLIPDGAVQ